MVGGVGTLIGKKVKLRLKRVDYNPILNIRIIADKQRLTFVTPDGSHRRYHDIFTQYDIPDNRRQWVNIGGRIDYRLRDLRTKISRNILFYHASLLLKESTKQ